MGLRLLFTLPLLLAGACGRDDSASVGDQYQARAADVAEVSDPDMLRPGKWETKQEIEGVANADLPADSKAEIAKTSASIDQCLPPDEARQPDPNFFAGSDESECKYTNFLMRDGRLEASITCTVTPGTMTMSLKGNYTPTSYALDATATTSGTGDAPISTSAQLTGTWLEACPNEQAQRQPPAAMVNRQAEQAPQPPAMEAGR